MAKELKPGDAAPDFRLPRDGGATLSLADFAGRKLVLYFYPKDDTSGCTMEALEFNGLARDPVKKHDKFRDKYGLSFPLLADEDKAMLDAYGVWVEKSMYGRKYMGVERSTFLIGADGTILKIWRKVKAKGHAAEALEAVRSI